MPSLEFALIKSSMSQTSGTRKKIASSLTWNLLHQPIAQLLWLDWFLKAWTFFIAIQIKNMCRHDILSRRSWLDYTFLSILWVLIYIKFKLEFASPTNNTTWLIPEDLVIFTTTPEDLKWVQACFVSFIHLLTYLFIYLNPNPSNFTINLAAENRRCGVQNYICGFNVYGNHLEEGTTQGSCQETPSAQDFVHI